MVIIININKKVKYILSSFDFNTNSIKNLNGKIVSATLKNVNFNKNISLTIN